jgi:hypothetical protein
MRPIEYCALFFSGPQIVGYRIRQQRFNSASPRQRWWCNASTPDIPESFLARQFSDGPQLWIIACYWFESNLLHLMGQ